jgi:hypothetical protein
VCRLGARRELAIAAIALIAASAPARAQATVDDSVAVFELGAPPQDTFLLHGTLPIPPQFYPHSLDEDPFQVIDVDGTAVPAQTEIVSRYPNDSDGADVVEVLARVHTPPQANPGDRIQYTVVHRVHPSTVLVPDPDVDQLLSTPGSLVLRASDVFQNTYSADLYEDALGSPGPSLRVLRRGNIAEQVATHETLLPDVVVPGDQGTLPHFMGAHSYVTTWQGEKFFSLDLRIHNAHSGRDHSTTADDPLGKIYFRTIELRLPHGWVLVPDINDPQIGDPYNEGEYVVWPIVAPRPDGTMHMMPAMSQFERRFAVVMHGHETEALSLLRQGGLAFAREGSNSQGVPYYSWWNPATARYFPQRQRLPSFAGLDLDSLRAADHDAFMTHSGEIMSGNAGLYPELSPALGWAHPWGVPDGGMAGGDEIYLIDGVIAAGAASTDGYRVHQLVHRMYTERQPNVLYNEDGRHTALEEWIVQGPAYEYVPIWWYNSPMLWASDPFGFNQAPTFQVDHVTSAGLQPDYEGNLLGYHPIDEAHLVRYTHNAKVLVWLGNDALAKDDIRAQAEGFRFAYHMYPQDQWYAVQPTGMLYWRNYIDAQPGWGFAYGRGEAWGLDVMCAAYSTQGPAWRAKTKAWFGLVADLVRDGQSDCTGIIQATPMDVFGGQYRNRQSIEAAITENALMGMRLSVFENVDEQRVHEINGILSRSFYAMISPLVWSTSDHGPWAMIAVGLADMSQPPFCTYWPPDGNYGIADHYQTWSSFAYAYILTSDSIFLARASEMAGNPLTIAFQQNPLVNLPNTAALWALVQQL